MDKNDSTMSNPNKGKVVIEFDENNSVRFTIQVDNVHPLQMFALSEWMKYEATRVLQRQEYAEMMKQQQEFQQQGQSKIIVPTPKIVPGR